jgi:hypothetical protein
MIGRSTRRCPRVGAAVTAHARWREERDAVRAAYRVWIAATASGEPLAFEAYQAALDREERAEKTYAGLMSRAGHLTKTGFAHQLAWMDSLSGGW